MLRKEELTVEDLQEQHREYAELIGVDKLLLLSQHFGGTQIYIPKPGELFKKRIYEKIQEEFDGTNLRQLAKKYQVSESTVYRLVREEIVKRKNTPLEGQLSIWDITEPPR